MTTRRSLLQSGNSREASVVAAMLDHHETFKSKHIKQNSGLIRRNIDIVKSNLELQIKLDSLNNLNLSLEISRLKLKKEIRRLNSELEKVKFNSEDSNGLFLNDTMRQNLMETVESLQNLLGNRSTNQQQQQQQFQPSSPTPSLQSSSPTSNSQPNSNVTISRRRSSSSNQIPVVQQRQNLVSTRPELSYISEGSIEECSEYGVVEGGEEEGYNGSILEGLNEEASILSQYSQYAQSQSQSPSQRIYQSPSPTPSPSTSSSSITQPLPSIVSPPPPPEEEEQEDQVSSPIRKKPLVKPTRSTNSKNSKPPPANSSHASTSTNNLDFRRPARRVSGLVKPIISGGTSASTGGRSIFNNSGASGKGELGESVLEEVDLEAMDRIGRRALRLSLGDSAAPASLPVGVSTASITTSKSTKGKGRETISSSASSTGGAKDDIEWDQQTELTLVQQRENDKRVLKEIQLQSSASTSTSLTVGKGRGRISSSTSSASTGKASGSLARGKVLSSSSEDENVEEEDVSDYYEEEENNSSKKKQQKNVTTSRRSSSARSSTSNFISKPRVSTLPKKIVPLQEEESEERDEIVEFTRPVLSKKNSSNRISAAFKLAEIIPEPEEEVHEAFFDAEMQVEEETYSYSQPQPTYFRESMEVESNSRASIGGGRSRKSVNYALPKLNSKMRRPDDYISTTHLKPASSSAPSSTKPRKSSKPHPPPSSNGGRNSISVFSASDRLNDESDSD